MMYALPLQSPPLLVVSDRLSIEVHTNFTGMPSERHVVGIDDLISADARQKLRWLWTEPQRFQPRRSNRDITEEAAQTFAGTAKRLRDAGTAPEAVSHFLSQCLFCFFAEDVGLLPAHLFERLVGLQASPERLRQQLDLLFATMRDGGLFGPEDICWFNGGLFRHIAIPALGADDVAALKAASALNWSAIDPSIFGTLFERGLDPSKRSQLGAHYTDPGTILRLVEPVVQRPLLAEWAACRTQIEERLARRDALRAEAAATPSSTPQLKARFGRLRTSANEAEREAQRAFQIFLERLRDYRVLDPACGSGNFLYLALKALKDIEHQVNLEAEALGLQRQHDVTGPHNVLGIELNEYAAELARLTVWIGELQWRIQHGYGFNTRPVLQALDHIECRDALINPDGSEAAWPPADSAVGNPPFVGDKKMRAELGGPYTEQLRATFKGRVPGGADLVCYWFEKARAMIEAGAMQRAGLVSTNSIRGGRNREVLDQICTTTRIFEAWSDEDWINDGAAVRVSLIAFGNSVQVASIDGKVVDGVSADISSNESGPVVDLTTAHQLREAASACFMGITKVGPFDIEGGEARTWLRLPNPTGESNAAVVRPSWNGMDVVRRNRDVWIVDFGTTRTESESTMFEAPFEYAQKIIQPFRQTNNREAYRVNWWRHGEARPGLRRLIRPLPRFIATPEVAKHRVFVWVPSIVLPDKNLQCCPRSDDATFGTLHSRFHELWSLRMCTWMGVGNDPRYTPTTCFETYPFPAGLTPADTAHQRTEVLADGVVIPADLAAAVRVQAEAIARAAHRLNSLRENWLNPPEWSERVAEVVPLGMSSSPYPDRVVAKAGFEKELAKRTLTNLYNLRPAWLAKAHQALDAAVAGAYGWADYRAAMGDDEILRRLLALNLQRAAGSQGTSG
jgi:hypothetical protein